MRHACRVEDGPNQLAKEHSQHVCVARPQASPSVLSQPSAADLTYGRLPFLQTDGYHIRTAKNMPNMNKLSYVRYLL